MLTLTPAQQGMLDGARGPAVAMAMRMVAGIARVKGAERLVGITRAHIDSCLYHGDSGLAYARRLADLGAACAVPTTANVGSVDLLHREFRPRGELTTRQGARLMELYAQLGVQQTWTCAPYHLPSRPEEGEHIAWAESNAIVFANSVLGARTDRYGDFLDICAAITGFAPLAGLHLEENRRPTLHLDCSRITERGEHVLPLLGYLAGTRAGTGVPFISGLAEVPGEEGLKALGAAAASAGGVALFHVEGVTPEAARAERAVAEAGLPAAALTDEDLARARSELSGLPPGQRIDAVSLGTPHASLAELRALASELRRPQDARLRVPVWVSTGRVTLAHLQEQSAEDAAVLDAAGVRIVTDTCTYLHPLEDETVRAVMTNSAKWAHYAPGNIGVAVAFGSLAECVRAARTGCVP
ncbi:aconitase X catalytic domain-containing protein [Brevibacterium sp.]|uniref:aconitase X catalytic domain-containing protein n=1 Tax=Brevibacterium sp. TaxID=1701 RepID=UPI0025BBE740|nr:aconitase X catalytic domain-containing protein [Brevibacterium sp.]